MKLRPGWASVWLVILPVVTRGRGSRSVTFHSESWLADTSKEETTGRVGMAVHKPR